MNVAMDILRRSGGPWHIIWRPGHVEEPVSVIVVMFFLAAVKQGFVVQGSGQYLISSTCWFCFALELKGTKA